MATDLIRYDVLVQQALRGVVRKVLADGAKDGLPGSHHFYISFDTNAPGVKLSPRLREMYPEEMTVVLQHQFWDLSVSETGFEVSLSFDKIAERLVIPFDSVTGFFDPSVKFGLKFEAVQAEGADAPVAEKTGKARKTKPKAEGDAPVATLPKKPKAPAKTDTPPEDAPAAPAAEAPAEGETGTAEVVSLDAFRKKK
ncbi:MAG: ClpXP protease specificity-enhancing factor SspB [Proteobacteria bacterium]|nr:ClpXP protease specificity-enhancing factor SspB [Pseudomonadota bacterium]